MESEKAGQDRKVMDSAFIAELVSIKQDALDAYAAATKANIKTEDDAPSPERFESAPHGLNPEGKPKRLFSFASFDEPMSTSSKWKL